jgi:diguanylate cyclase (GGDEF)-like protein
MNTKSLKFINWPVQVKGMFLISLCQLALSGILFSGVTHRTDNSFRTQVKTAGLEIDTLMGVSLTDPLLHHDYALLQQVTDELVEKKTVTGLRVIGPTGRKMAESGMTEKLNGLLKSDDVDKVQWSETQHLRHSTALSYGGQHLGNIQYISSLDSHIAERKGLLSDFILIALTTTVLAILAAYFLSGRLVKRIIAINDISDAATNGQYSARVQVDSEDELGKLAKGLNRLADSVTDRMKALIDSDEQKTSYLISARTEQARLTSLLDSMRLGIVFLNNQQELVYSNQAVKGIWPNELPSFIGKATDHGRERTLENGRIIFETSHTVLANNASSDLILEAEHVEDRAIGSLWIFEDVTAERQTENTIRFLAERDPLTSLYNRRSFTSALQTAIANSNSQPLALVYIDIDDFKIINDLKGHQEGDKILIATANKLSAASRSTDIVARIGGDEFVVLATGIPFEDQTSWCDRLVTQLASISPDDGSPGVSCSMGLAWYPKDGDNAERLLAAGDEAMYDAKRAGKNVWRSFSKHAQRSEEKAKTMLWAERISQALRSDGFEIFLQGVHRASDKAVHHFEALIRMPDPGNPGTRFNPADFIGQAEASGKITQLDRWMIQKCIELLAAQPQLPPIAVNMSAISLSDPSLTSFVASQLLANNVSGRRLHLELTETAALSDINTAQVAVASLQKLGCSICLDDFGSGFASLAYLKLINANYLKIDGMFIKGINEDKENQVLLRAIVDIAQSSDRLTVAEWIEDEAMLNTVRGFKIDLVQGYHLSKPAPAKEVIGEFLAKVLKN